MGQVVCRWLVFFLLAGCGGGSGGGSSVPAVTPPPPIQSPPPVTYDFRDYAPLRKGRKSSGWESVQVGPDRFDIHWLPDSWEEQRIAPNPQDNGALWVYLDAYTSSTIRYVSWATRTEINRGAGWVDVTPTTQTTPYAPVSLSGTVSIRSWGWIVQDGKTIKRWFHFHTLRPIANPPGVFNACWTGADMTRSVIEQREAWWDGYESWSDRGSGAIDAATREPSGDGITFVYTNNIALDAGYLWTGGYPGGQQYCLAF